MRSEPRQPDQPQAQSHPESAPAPAAAPAIAPALVPLAVPELEPQHRVFTSTNSFGSLPPSQHQPHTIHHSLAYYSLPYPTRGRHDHRSPSPVSNAFPPRPPFPHYYPARIADAPNVKDDLTARPPLRKKPKLTSHPSDPNTPLDCNSIPERDGHDHSHKHAPSGMRKLVGIPKTSSVPSFHITLGVDDPNNNRPSSSSGIVQPSVPLHRTNSHPLQRSPSQKKPPASHSSYGVETTCGPPPSYSTQRTLSQDRIRLERNTTSNSRSGNSGTQDTSPTKPNEPVPDSESIAPQLSPVKQDLTVPISTAPSADDLKIRESSSPENQSLLTPNSAMSNDIAASVEAADLQEKENADPQHLKPVNTEDDGKGSSSDEKKSEDLFLNIARADAERGDQTHLKPDKRRSRISLPFFSSTRPSTGYKSSPIQDRFDTSSISGRSEALNYYSKRSSFGHHVPGAMSRAYTQEASIREASGGGVQDTLSAHPGDFPRRGVSRRHSNTNTNTNTNTESVRQYPRPSTARNSRLISDSAFLDPPRVADHVATESTISTTAPSTVWDELDDLKSRIRKLELTGKLPPSSAAAMTSTATERPKTATTAATTLSSSPKHKPAATQLQSAIEGIPSTIHPNLHEALGNAKAVVSNEVFQKLQATAQDALQLSMMMNPEGYTTTGSTIGTASVSERQVRRRTESMCRSLTELAIAILADNKQPAQPPTRPGSRDAFLSSSAGLRSRRYSNEANDRPPVTSRVQSRLESRRTSVPLGTTLNSQTTTPEINYQTPPSALPQIPSTSSSRLGRTSTLVRSRRTPGYLDGTTDDEEGSPSVRPVSRAMTEVSTYRQMARDRAAYSREYTAQHPMPATLVVSPPDSSSVTRSHLPANMSSSLVSRRKYPPTAGSTETQVKTPVTPKEPWGRISIVPAVASSPLEATPDSQPGVRSSNSRRSLGLASRITSVSSRLRAVKAERNAGVRETIESRAGREIAPSGQDLDNRLLLERQGSGQSITEV